MRSAEFYAALSKPPPDHRPTAFSLQGDFGKPVASSSRDLAQENRDGSLCLKSDCRYEIKHIFGLSSTEKLARAVHARHWDEALVHLEKAGVSGLSLFHRVLSIAPPEVVRVWLAHGADPHERGGPNGETAINVAALSRRADLIALLVEHGGEVAQQDATGLSSLMVAAYLKDATTLRVLLSTGAPLEQKDREGFTALMFACDAGAEECVTCLLGAGADPNARDAMNSAPILFAAQHGHLGCVIALVAATADPDATNDQGLDARAFATQNGHASVVAWLDAWKAGPRPFEPRRFRPSP